MATRTLLHPSHRSPVPFQEKLLCAFETLFVPTMCYIPFKINSLLRLFTFVEK